MTLADKELRAAGAYTGYTSAALCTTRRRAVEGRRLIVHSLDARDYANNTS